jgi:hypothetical protein
VARAGAAAATAVVAAAARVVAATVAAATAAVVAATGAAVSPCQSPNGDERKLHIPAATVAAPALEATCAAAPLPFLAFFA